MYLYVRDLCCVHMGVYLSPAFILISNMMAPSRRSLDSATTPHSSSPRSYSCPLIIKWPDTVILSQTPKHATISTKTLFVPTLSIVATDVLV